MIVTNKVRTKGKVRLVLAKITRHDATLAVMYPVVAHAADKRLKLTSKHLNKLS